MCSFTLSAEGDGTLRVVESGFATLDCSEEARDANADANRKGWALELDDLRQHAQNVTA